MMNLKIFDKNSPDSGKYRGCVKSAEVLARIDKALASKHVDENELNEIERLVRTASLVYPAPYLMIALFNPNHIPTSQSMKTTEKPAPIKEPVKTPVVDNDDNKGTGEPGLGIEDPTLNPGVGHPADEGTGEPSGEPAPEPIEPVGEGIPDGEPAPADMEPTNEETTEPTGEPAPAEDTTEAPADMEPANEETTELTGEPVPTNEPTPAEETTEPPAESAQPKAKRGRKKADAAE